MPKKKPTKVCRYDGQSIWTTPDLGYPSYSDYELGSFLGGGAAGVVYEAECFKTKRRLAVKVLNPIGYKLAPSGSLRFCEVVVKGQPYGDVGGGRGSRGGSQGLSGAGGGGGAGGVGWGPSKMSEKHVWWLVNASTRQTFAAYYDARTGMLKEMTLPKCIEVWGLGDDKGRRRERKKDRERDRIRQEERLDRVFVGGEWLPIPSAPAKYDKFLRARASILREINNMLQLSEHPNILRLHEALELVQDSKATIFLVLELARGGELFDRIKVDCGADEGAARHYFRQLLSGVRHCHDRGVCHRDLKPENLLLANPDDSSVLKIADFGFSALFRELESESSSGDDSSGSTSAGSLGLGPAALRRQASSGLSSRGGRARSGAGGARAGTGSSVDGRSVKGPGVRRLMSVVGSPYYVAPEVLREDTVHGYDGTKADVWSMGVILYAMLAGNLPFEKELLTCKRFAKFGTWARQSFATASLRAHSSGNPKDAMDMDCLDYPSWFYPQHFSFAARSLLSGLLHPDASSRLSVHQALRHPWVRDGRLYTRSGGSGSSDGSDFGVGAERGDGERHAPDPQDIPTELLGADSDFEEEDDLGSLLGRKENGNQNETRGGHCLRARRPSPAVVSRPGRQDGGYALSEVGVSGTTVVAEAVAATAGNATSVAVNVTCGGSSGGVSEESAPLVATVVVGSKKKVVDATSGHRRGVRVVRQASPPKPAPPPSVPVPVTAPASPPPSPAAGQLVATQSTSASATTLAEAEEEMGRQTRVGDSWTATAITPGGSGDVKNASGVTVMSIGTTSRGEGDGLTSGETNSSGIAVHVVDDADQCLGPGNAVLGEGVVTVAATPTTAAVAAEAAAEEDAVATRAAKSTAAGGGGLATVAVAVTPRSPPHVTSRKTLVTPTKTTSSARPLDVFSSPPLAPVGSGLIAEEDGSEFLLDAGQSPSATNRTIGRTWRSKSRDGLPPSGAGHPVVGGAPQALGTVDRTPSMGVAGMTIVEAEADTEEGLQEDLMTTPPAFNDLVKRSTRFMTSVPAAVVLRKIATIINADAHPLPYPYRNIRQKAIVHQGEYKLEIMRGGVLVCTVQIYLLGGEQRAAQYMVEFLRGQLDIFLFKRFYEDVRCKLNDLVKRDYSLALLDSGVCTNRFRRFSNLA